MKKEIVVDLVRPKLYILDHLLRSDAHSDLNLIADRPYHLIGFRRSGQGIDHPESYSALFDGPRSP